MKKIFLLLALCLPMLLKAQVSFRSVNILHQIDTTKAIVKVVWNFDNIYFYSDTLDNSNDTLYLKMYYQFGPSHGITKTIIDTISLGVLDPRIKTLASCFFYFADSTTAILEVNPACINTPLHPISIANIQVSSKLNCYPNPVKAIANISFFSPTTGAATILITDLTGKLVIQQSVRVNSGYHPQQIDLSHCPPGVYLIKCNSGGGISYGRLVKD